MSYWHVEINLEGDTRYAADMPETNTRSSTQRKSSI